MTRSIHEACQRGDVDAVRRLVDADPACVDAADEHGWRPLFHAALYRRIEVVRYLLEAGVDVAARDGYALHYAGEVPDNKEIVALLLQYGALESHVRPRDDLARQFMAAVFLADHARVKALLKRYPQLATIDAGRGNQPIHHAACNGDTEIIRLLIEHGADVNAREDRKLTVLYCAAGHGHLAAVQLLLEQGADMNAQITDDRMTLLEWLAQYPDDERFVPVTNALLERQGGP